MGTTTRRKFIKETLLVSAAATLTQASAQEPAGNVAPAGDGALPCGMIGDLSVSRMLLGGNLLTHYTHSRDLKYVYNLCAHYNTEKKILETLALAEQHGVNTLVVHTAPGIVDTLKKHRYQEGGKIQWIICPTAPVEGDLSEYTKQVRELANEGTEAIYLWGVRGDALASEGKTGLIAEAVNIVKEQGLPSGVGAHDLKVITECERTGVDADFYIKTFHHHNYPSAPRPDQLVNPYNEVPGYWCRGPQEVIDCMSTVEKPWLAFKVMAAGAIPPSDAFQYAFDSGADHILVGMFDFEIAEDVATVKNCLANAKRTRPWRS